MYGALGAISPDIIILYSKRWTAPTLTFSWTQYTVATLVYMLLAGILATIYSKRPTPLSGFTVGLLTPSVISLFGSLVLTKTVQFRGLEANYGNLSDLFTLF